MVFKFYILLNIYYVSIVFIELFLTNKFAFALEIKPVNLDHA